MTARTKEQRSHEIRMTLLSFLLTTVAGAIITFTFQWMEERHKEQASKDAEMLQLLEQRRTAATDLFNQLAPLMDRRLYLWRQVAWALEDGVGKEELSVKREEYHKALYEWNVSLNRNRALLCRFFGPKTGNQFENEIMPEFRRLQQVLNKALHDSLNSTQHPQHLADEADDLNHRIYAFDSVLAETIRSGDIGSKNPDQACNFELIQDQGGR